jgi:hypothetical protein
VHAYQQAHNLTVNGELDSATMASLKTAPVGNEAPAPVPVAMAPPMPPAASTTTAPPAPAAK